MSTALQSLEVFIAEAKQARSVEALLEQAAATAVRLTGAEHGIAWFVDRRADEAIHHVGSVGIEGGPAKNPTAWPALVERAMTTQASGRQHDVVREDLGISGGAPFASVDWVTGHRTDLVGCWLGVCSSREAVVLSPERTSLLQILVEHLLVRQQALHGDEGATAAEFRYRKFIEELPAMTYARALDKPGEAAFISPQSMGILGYGPEEFLGSRNLFVDRLHPDDRERVLAEQAVFDPGAKTTIQTFNYRMLHKDGHVVWLLNHLRTVRAEDGAASFITGVLIDVSEPEQRARAIAMQAAEEEELRRVAESRSRAKSSFLAQMSHELRTPLNGILGTCEALKEEVYGVLEPKQREAMTNIEQAGRHQLSLVNDLLDLSRIESGGFEPTMEQVSLTDICTEAVRMMRAQAKQAGVSLGLSMDGEVDEIVSDQRRVRQIVLNLTGNAVKFTPKGGRVGLELEMRDEHAAITVWDTGIGIAPEELPRMFEAFTQLDSLQSRQHAGSGLGLNLCAKLASALGGRIEAESEEGAGSRFTVLLPLKVTVGVGGAEEMSNPQPTPDLADAARPVTERRTMAVGEGLDVLLVDDTLANIGHVRDFLESKGHRVTVGRNGLEALELAQALPDIVFMDVQMPEMDGLEATRRLRADEKTRDLYIVALTSFAMGEDRARCIEAGADDYQTKPVSIRTLLDIVEARRG